MIQKESMAFMLDDTSLTRVQLPDLFVTSCSNPCTIARQRNWPSIEQSNGQWKVCQLSNLMNGDDNGEIVSTSLLRDVCWPQLPPLGDVILAVELPLSHRRSRLSLFPMVLPVHQCLPPSWVCIDWTPGERYLQHNEELCYLKVAIQKRTKT
jgi:hypothetical protein